MKENSNDPRVIRTRLLLRNALMSLAAEKSFSTLNVLDITERAGLNRTTFYLHYKGMHELLEDCAHSLFAELRAQIYADNPSLIKAPFSKFVPLIEIVFNHLGAYKPFYRAMLGKHGDPYFRALFQELLSELLFESILDKSPQLQQEQRFEINRQFFTSGFAGIAIWWLEMPVPIPAANAAQQVAADLLPDFMHLFEQYSQ